MNHYIGEDGYSIKYVGEEEDLNLVDHLVEEWNNLVKMELSKDDHYTAFSKIYRDYIWSCHDIMYQHHITESLSGFGGGPTMEELYSDDPKMRKMLDSFIRWIDHGMFEKEYQMYFHDLICEFTFSFYFSDGEK